MQLVSRLSSFPPPSMHMGYREYRFADVIDGRSPDGVRTPIYRQHFGFRIGPEPTPIFTHIDQEDVSGIFFRLILVRMMEKLNSLCTCAYVRTILIRPCFLFLLEFQINTARRDMAAIWRFTGASKKLNYYCRTKKIKNNRYTYVVVR